MLQNTDKITEFLGDGMWLGYPNPGGNKCLRYCERLVWAGMFHIHDNFKAHELAKLVTESQADKLETTTTGHALRKFRLRGFLTVVRPRKESSVYSFTPYFLQVRGIHFG